MSTKSLRSLLRITFALILTLGSLTLLHSPTVNAASTLTVTKVADTDDGACDADCSLREAIAAAASGDTIIFAGSLAGQTITLGNQLDITKDLTIDGSSLSIHVKISGNNDVRVFSIINRSINVFLTHLDILNGYTWGDQGGGIYNEGTLTVRNITFSGNSATSSPYMALQGAGGGISNLGTLTVQNSALFNNYADYAGGGIFNNGMLTVQNSTISSNSSTEGGGITNFGTLTVQNSTIAGNSANYFSGGIYNGSTLNYENTIIAYNPTGGDCYNSGTIGMNNTNLVEDGSCDSGLSGDPLLGPLADNGGDTWTLALQPGSPAIDAGDNATCLATDQRGFPRPYPVGGTCDIGAYEIGPLRLSKTATPATEVPYHGLVTYSLVLSNTGEADYPNVSLTDTLPAEVAFDGWVGSPPANTTITAGTIQWNGSLDAKQEIAWIFQVRHTGNYDDHVSNLARFNSATDRGNVQGSFDVECAPTYTVHNANGNGVGSLPQAIAGVCPGGRIIFSDDFSIYLDSELEIARSLTIDGEDHAITISGDTGHDGSPNVRVFDITAGSIVTLSHLSIVSGTAGTTIDGGGGIYNGGTLTVKNCTLSGNFAEYDGGGISNDGTLTVQNSTLSGNSSTEGGGISNSGTLTVMNSTLSGNSADMFGGGIYNTDYIGGNIVTAGMLTVTNSTLSGNSAGYDGGGIWTFGHVNYENTIIANSGSGGDCANGRTISTNNHNLVEDGSCSGHGINFLTGDPLLGPLADNGGDTWTHALLPGSLAIDAGDDATCLATDQRGVPRPQGAHCDIGSYEQQRFFIYLPLVLR